MAVAARKRVVVNRGRPRRNTARRKLSAKQIKFFGTTAQKAALKRSRHSKRSKPNKGAPFSRKTRRAKAKSHRSRTSPRKRSNPGDILSLALLPSGNPGRKKRSKSMAAPRKRRRRARTSQRRNTRRRAARKNPGTRMHRRRNHHSTHRRRTRRNTGMGRRVAAASGLKGTMITIIAGAGGYFGSKALTQIVLGANNTGSGGYFANAMITAGMAAAAHFAGFRNISMGVLAGGAIQIIQRILTDKTPLGQLGTSFGMGDYQMQNFVTPQRLVDPLNSAQIEIPSGWGAPPAVVINGASAPGGVHGYNAPGPGLYSSKGLYS